MAFELKFRRFVRMAVSAVCVLALLFSVRSASALGFDDFMYGVELRGAVAGAKIFMAPVTVEMAERARAGFDDLRILAGDSSEVPYAIVDDYTPPEYGNEYYSMSVSDYKDETDSVELVMEMPDRRKPVEIIEIETLNTDFRKHVVLFGGNDGRNWERLASEPIFDFSSQVNYRKTDFKLGRRCDYKYYKFVINNASPSRGPRGESIRLSYEGLDFSVDKFKEQKLKIEGVNARTAFNVKKDGLRNYDGKTFEAVTAKLDKSNDSVIGVEANLYFDRVIFDIAEAYYKRRVRVYFSETGAEDSYRFLADFSIYNIPLDEYRTTRVDWWYSSPKHRFFRFVIENGNNPPLKINSVRFEFVRKKIFFVPSAAPGPYLACFGNPELKRPVYDISSFINQGNWYRQSYCALSCGPLILNAAYREKKAPEPIKPQVEKALLTVIVIIVIAALGFWLFNLMAAVPTPNERDGGDESGRGGAGHDDAKE